MKKVAKETKEKLGANIRTAREIANCTQEKLAECIGKPVKYIADLEAGLKMPTMEVMLDIAHTLGFTVDALVNGNISEGSYPFDKIDELLADTTPEERKILFEEMASMRDKLKKNKPHRKDNKSD